MSNKNILFITTAFSPENAVGSIRTTKIVKYLVRTNFKVTVISPKLNENTKLDYSNECTELNKVERILIPHSKLFESIFLKKRNKMLQKKSASNYIQIKNKKSLYSIIKSQLFIIIHFIYTIIRNLDWSRQVKKYLVLNKKINEYSSVISSYPSLSSHWVSFYLSKKHNLFWIADFRDPINYEANSNNIIIKINTILQNRIIRQANYVTTISNDLLLKFNPNNKFNKNKLIYIPNGFDPDDLKIDNLNKVAVRNKDLNLCYVGSLYGGKRDLNIVFKAIKELINEEKININSVKFVYAGNEFNVLEEQANKYNLSKILVNKGFVSRLESVKIQSNSDLIVIVTWNTESDKGIMTGKLFECLLTEKVMLGVVNGTVPNSEFKQLIKKINGGIVYEDSSLEPKGEFQNFKKFIFDKYNEKQNKSNIESTYNKLINEYTYSKITKSFIDLIEQSSI